MKKNKMVNYEVTCKRIGRFFRGYHGVVKDSDRVREMESQGKIKITPIEGQEELFGETW